MKASKFFPFSFLLPLIFLAFVLIPLHAEIPAQGTASFLLENLAVPESIGKIQERFSGKSGRMVIQIQDVHAHVTAQENIAAILEHIQTVSGISKVGLEGAWSQTDLPKSQAIPTSREKQLLGRTLLEEDLISGPIYAALFAPQPILLMGMEEAALYQENRKIFLEHLEKSKSLRAKIASYDNELKETKAGSWNPKLLAFGKEFDHFKDTSDLGKFFPVLVIAGDDHEIGFEDLSQILLTEKILELEKSISKEKLGQEVKQLMRAFKDTPWNLEELIRGNQIPPEKLGFYPEIKKLQQLFALRDQIVLAELMSQIESFTQRVLTKLIRSPEESDLWEQSERFSLAKRLLFLKATPQDLKVYEEEKIAVDQDMEKAGLSAELEISVSFYDVVKKRDEIFFEKITKNASLEGPIIIVTGGFHTDGLSQKFREAGISYITIAPELGGESMNEKLYTERMRTSGTETASVTNAKPFQAGDSRRIQKGKATDQQTLSELNNATEKIDDRLYRAYRALVETNDARRAVRVFRGDESAEALTTTSAALPKGLRPEMARSITSSTTAQGINPASFVSTPRLEQLKQVRVWLDQAQLGGQKAVLVSSVSAMSKLLENPQALPLLNQMAAHKDVLFLQQDVPLPATLRDLPGMESYAAEDLDALMQGSERFQILVEKLPPVIIKEGYKNARYVVLPENWLSFTLYRIITLSPNLYRAAKNPAFVSLLSNLISEILSQEVSKKAA